MQTPRNRRACRRHKPKASAKAFCLKGSLGLGRNIAVSIIDVSETGARLMVKEAIKQEQDVEVILEHTSLAKPVKRVGKVMWCEPTEEGSYRIGVRFEKLLLYTDWQSLTISG